VAGRSGVRLAQLLIVATLLGACASGPTAGDAPAAPAHHADVRELVAAVAERQRAERTARLSLRGELAARDATLRFTGQGVLQVADDGVSVKFSQVVTQPGAPPQETGFVILPDAAYLRVPPNPDSVDARPWVRVDPTSTDPEAQRLAAQAATLAESADPATSLSRYAEATSLVDATDDVIDGDPAVRYTIAVDLVRAAATQTDPAVRDRLEQQVRGGLTRLTSTLWLDPLDRPVRSAVLQELPGIGTLTILVSYRDWGQPVRIEPPPAGQVR
jgi:hypothetical protein